MPKRPTKKWALLTGFRQGHDYFEFRYCVPDRMDYADLYLFGTGHTRFRAVVFHGEKTKSVIELENPTVSRIEASCAAIGFSLPNNRLCIAEA